MGPATRATKLVAGSGGRSLFLKGGAAAALLIKIYRTSGCVNGPRDATGNATLYDVAEGNAMRIATLPGSLRVTFTSRVPNRDRQAVIEYGYQREEHEDDPQDSA